MLVLGLDVGGTASRALVTTTDGTRLGFGQAGAANPVMVPLSEAVANVSDAVRAAVSEVDPGDIRSAVMGIAGTSRFASYEVSTAFAKAFTDLGIVCPLHPVGDVMVAYAAGTAEPVGSVLISGTGAVAAQISDGAMTKVADGLGWLLGDLGSGFWLGRSAAIATARALARGTRNRLTELVIEAVGFDDLDGFVIALHDAPPRDLAHLAPLVTQAALDRDATALSIVDQAAIHLVDTVTEVHGAPPHSRASLGQGPAPSPVPAADGRGQDGGALHPDDESFPGAANRAGHMASGPPSPGSGGGDAGPIVLAGSVLKQSVPVCDAVRFRLRARFPHTPIYVAGEGEAGAARLAARWLV